MELVPIKTVNGEEKAWKLLEDLAANDVCQRASAGHDVEKGLYIIKSFGIDFCVSPSERRIFSNNPKSIIFLDKFRDFFRLSLLWYLSSAKDIPFTGRLIRPIDVKGGQRFFTGTHLLPLDRVAAAYGADRDKFIRRGLELGATEARYGDASLIISPLPRVPITLILWLEDEEFPARADLLFDSTCDLQIGLSDIVWSLAMLTTLVMSEF
jgi:hypothetical protein